MISIIIYQNQSNQYVGFSTQGHADFSEPGTDIICSAVSALTINAINSIEKFSNAKFSLDTNQEDGEFDFKITSECDDISTLLLDSMILGLKGIQKDYGKRYLSLKFKEV